MADYYEVLGVARGADAAEIKRAFRARARQLHPDVSSDPDAEDRFRELADAYAALSKPARAAAVRPLRLSRPRRMDGVAAALRQRASWGSVELGFYEAARGGRRTVRYATRVDCPACATGPCLACDGRGTTRESIDEGDIRVLQLVTCVVCGGTGRAAVSCERCAGSGRIEVEREAEVTIPSGVENGARVPVGPDGEHVVVRVRPQPRDPAALRLAAALGLVAAVAFLLFLLLG